MTPLDASLVRRKLAVIAANLDDLAAVEGLTIDAFRADRIRQKATERLLQEIVDAAADINLHLLRVAGAGAAADYFGSFIAAGEAGIIPADLARELAPSAGLRNRLVHEYDRLDDAIVLAAAGDARARSPAFVAAVERYVQQAGHG